ncbi:hypothetical protein [Streptomyces wuyuanensis]|uniref:hypothetical protein n=1 Tax=Streptomyces wuyuanensis TaxID=1196353 RepID=UPI003F542358
MRFIEVAPACTSQRCPRCGRTECANRCTRGHFAGANIVMRGVAAWAFVNLPAPAAARVGIGRCDP